MTTEFLNFTDQSGADHEEISNKSGADHEEISHQSGADEISHQSGTDHDEISHQPEGDEILSEFLCPAYLNNETVSDAELIQAETAASNE